MRPSCLQVVFVGVFLSLATLIVWHGRPRLIPPAQAQAAGADSLPPARPADRKAAIASIQAQLRAFQKGDFATAVRYQSSTLKRNFASPDGFRTMMQTHYPAFLTFKAASFGPAVSPDDGRHVLLPVTLTEGTGGKVQALYIMVREGKTYKVDGVEGGLAPDVNPDSVPSQVS